MFRVAISFWTVAWIASADPNKHYLDTDEVNLRHVRSVSCNRGNPIDFSRRIRRNLESGPTNFFIYDTDTAEEAGPWGPWQPAGDELCSRSCGGGVFIESRVCPAGSDCVGPSKRYSSCNIQPCPSGSRNFREEQCSKYDSQLFEGKYYQWIPYLKAPRKCELNCLPKGERFYYRHAKTVIDGTSCDLNDGKPRICVEGDCRLIGCDGMLGSEAEEDNCRVCGGDGSNCNTVSGVLTNEDLVMGYNDLLLIPSGATNIRISEVKASNNYLAIRNTSGHYFINGNWRIDFADNYEIAGTVFAYERKIRPGMKKSRAKLLSMFAPEELSALGPTTEPLYVVLLSQDKNPGIEFQYSIRSGAVKETPEGGETYDWEIGGWSDCSSPCGGGTQTRQVLCQASATKEIMPPHLCNENEKPLDVKACNENPCEPQWSSGEWSNCTALAPSEPGDAGSGEGSGEGLIPVDGECPGFMYRNVFCEQIASSSGLSTVVDDSLCKADERPPAYKSCDDVTDGGQESGPKYHVGPWTGCSVLCGDGVRTRIVTCFIRGAQGNVTAVPDEDCSSVPRPPDEEPCQAEKECAVHDWILTDWTKCDGQCGLFKKSRSAICTDSEGVPSNDTTMCDEERLPKLFKDCSEIEENSEEGSGFEGLEVESGDGSGFESGSGSKIELTLSEFVCEFSWFATQWSVCSSECSGLKGVQTRKVFCGSVDANNSISIETDEKCVETKKYSEEQECEGALVCDQGSWFASEWSTCSKSCGGGTRKRKVFCLKGGDKATPEDCKSDDILLSEEDCNTELCPEASGDGEEEEKCAAYYDDYWIFGEGSGDAEGPESEQLMVDSGVIEAGEDGSGSGEGSGDQGLTQEELMSMFSRRCKPEPVPPCQNSTFGCCDDEFHSATGPFEEGCETIETCDDTKFGCCRDGVTPANGTNFLGCPPVDCDAFLFGCCSDGETAADGPDGEGCEENLNCATAKFGCCPDKVTFAQGSRNQGCFQCPDEVWLCDSCEKTLWGCCLDLENAATGPNFEGCPDEEGSGARFVDCTISEHGCCPDGETRAKGPDFKGCTKATPCKDSLFGCCDDLVHPSHGPNKEGCCLNSKFGCCPDNVTPSQGPNQEGCSCEETEFGCCPDDVTPAKGKEFEGCGCVATKFGCCPDNFTPAEGPHFETCTCHTYEYGCCSDGKSIARGPGQEGCSCKDSEFGCCPDRQLPASGPRGEGCGCAASRFGCCPDGETDAEGENFMGCESDVMPVIVTPGM